MFAQMGVGIIPYVLTLQQLVFKIYTFSTIEWHNHSQAFLKYGLSGECYYMKTQRKIRACHGILALLLACATMPAFAETPDTTLFNGYHLLYNLNFDRAHDVFTTWSKNHPEDPLGPASDAAGYLFSEFNRLGVLESQFYESDKQFDARRKLTPDPALRDRFAAALDQAEKRAKAQLVKNPQDRDALFAMTLSAGLKADYAALIEKSNLTSLHFTRESEHWSEQLLAVDPNCYDAHLASGIAKYIVGSMSAPVRWLLRIGGVAGDKNDGIAELQLTANRGEYLAPFARILLSIAYVRDKDRSKARELLMALQSDFPNNPLFAKEIARLDQRP